MKNQILAFTSTLLLSSLAFASTITCKITTGVMQDGILYPGDNVTTVTTKLNESHTAGRNPDDYLASCTRVEMQKLSVRLCATKTEYVGVYHTGAIIEIASDKESSTFAEARLATLVNGKGLDTLSYTTAISPIIVKQLNEAGIEMPAEMPNHDSYLIDEALKAASQKGIEPKNGEIVSLDIDTCKLN